MSFIWYSFAMNHHASLIEAERDTGLIWAHTYVEEELHLPLRGNPDIETIERDRYTIEDARNLTARANQSPLGNAQVFIIVCESILLEAQNALLKLFEEPAPHTHFVIILPTRKGLLPTIQSRLSYRGRLLSTPTEIPFAEKFLQTTIADRIAMLQPILKDKDRAQARAFVDALEVTIHKKGVKEHEQALSEICLVRTYLRDTSSSLKMLLEHLAIVI
ncbi:TPA: hypothetical protein DEP58_05080 [Patescibacteria group bacterium]|nr:hypothetical protein [Patescibacteria group bacterium]